MNEKRIFYWRYGKRILDLILTVTALIILLPVMFVVALLIRLKLGSSVLFSQKRPGLNSKPFIIYKFRTMTNVRHKQGNLLTDAERLTSFGQFLRSTSLDELPELWNVITGKMSLVGPRPLRMRYLDFYTSTQNRRHEVKPGITGWAQINGRNAICWEERFKLDIWYVDNYSLTLDLKILWLTLVKVLRRESISAEGYATMTGFMGSQKREE